MNTRLVRSRTNVMLGGVCAGLANYLSLDPTLVRLFFVLLALASGTGVLIYLLLWLVIPAEDAVQPPSGDLGDRAGQVRDEFVSAVSKPNPNAAKWIGIGLIIAGGLFLLDNLHLPWLHWASRDLLWPLLLVLAGGVLLYRTLRKE